MGKREGSFFGKICEADGTLVCGGGSRMGGWLERKHLEAWGLGFVLEGDLAVWVGGQG